jgi:hypothetical protein
MEGYNGHARPLDTLVREHQWRLFNVNNLKLARFKQVFPAAAKTDRIDAQLGEHLPRVREALQEVQGAPEENLELKRSSRRRRALVDEKVRVLSRLQDDLQAVCPGLLEITGDADNLWFLNLLTHSEDLTKLAGLREKTLLSIPAIGAKFCSIIRAWQRRAFFSQEVAYAGPMIVADARRVLGAAQPDRGPGEAL